MNLLKINLNFLWNPNNFVMNYMNFLAFIKENKKDLKDVFGYLKNSKLGLDHSDFLEVSKKIEETDTFMNKPFDVEEGTVDCKRCKSKRTMTYGKQLRGADESTSVITYCVECKYRSISH